MDGSKHTECTVHVNVKNATMRMKCKFNSMVEYIRLIGQLYPVNFYLYFFVLISADLTYFIKY